jgi:hypothetical protein
VVSVESFCLTGHSATDIFLIFILNVLYYLNSQKPVVVAFQANKRRDPNQVALAVNNLYQCAYYNNLTECPYRVWANWYQVRKVYFVTHLDTTLVQYYSSSYSTDTGLIAM